MTDQSASSKIVPFPQMGITEWIDEYTQDCLHARDQATIEIYQRLLRHLLTWVAECPGHGKRFVPTQLTPTVVELYLSTLRD